MNLWEGVLLGVVQGLTEFLPVSSSGHLVIAQSLIEGFHQPGVLFDVMLHFGTLLAVVFFFRKDIGSILAALLPGAAEGQKGGVPVSVRRNTALCILVATAVTGIIGIAFEETVSRLFGSVRMAAAMLLVTGLLLFIAERIRAPYRTEGDMTLMDGLLIGLVQGIALIPGISRSGSTIAAGMMLKITGETAARFSFLLSVPAILGAMVLEFMKYSGSIPRSDIFVYAAGAAAAAVVGFFTLNLLFFMIKERKLKIFAYYCWFVGIATLMIL
ncbi:MAG: undecaprenyl-diphosphate phosphatase [Deltaproteobacteria bacterium]|nr:undecaprenyl-diphosphate phosphatase [Deltaproteobacteria bacterium]